MPVGVQCPISSSLDEFPSYWDWLWCPGLSSVLVSIALPFAFHTWCFPFAVICHWISIVFLFTTDVSPLIRSTLHFLTFSFSYSMEATVVMRTTLCTWVGHRPCDRSIRRA